MDGAGCTGTHNRIDRTVRRSETGQNGRHVLRHLARHERLRHLHEAIARRRRPHSAADRYAESVRQPETDDRKSAESAIRTAVGIPSLGRTLPGLLPGRRRLGNPQTRANADRCGRGRHHRRPDQCGDLPAAVEKPLQSIYADPGSRRKNPATVIHFQHAGPGDRPTSVRQFLRKRTVQRSMVLLERETADPMPSAGRNPAVRRLFHDPAFVVLLASGVGVVRRRTRQMAVGRLLSAECGLARIAR